MLRKVMSVSVVVLLLAGVLAPLGGYAQSATSEAWSTAITYYTPSDTGGTLQISYYAEGSSSPINADPITLAAHKAGSLFIGNVSGVGSTFSGGAVLSADVPIVATAVNIAGTSNFPRPLYSGFDPSQASTDFFIPTVLYQRFDTTSLVSIQNIESSSIQATLSVYAAGASTPSFEQTYTIQGQSAKVVPAGDMVATGIIKEAKRAGINVPKELAVVGFDDIPAAEVVEPMLTTVRQPKLEMGDHAINIIIDKVEGRETALKHKELPTKLIRRESE